MSFGLSTPDQLRLGAAVVGILAFARSIMVLVSGRLSWTDGLIFLTQSSCAFVLAVITLTQFKAPNRSVSGSIGDAAVSDVDSYGGKAPVESAHIFDWLRTVKGKKYATMEENLIERWKLSPKVSSRIRRFIDYITNDFVKFWYYGSKLRE
jgi:hypothetical protein